LNQASIEEDIFIQNIYKKKELECFNCKFQIQVQSVENKKNELDYFNWEFQI